MTEPADRPARREHESRHGADDDEKVEEASEESFPASDPPGYSGGSAMPRESESEPDHLDREEGGEKKKDDAD